MDQNIINNKSCDLIYHRSLFSLKLLVSEQLDFMFYILSMYCLCFPGKLVETRQQCDDALQEIEKHLISVNEKGQQLAMRTILWSCRRASLRSEAL